MIREYPIKHGGCAILCGAAPSLFEDLQEAKRLRPDAMIIGVKYAASLVPEIEHVWTQHGEMTLKIKAAAGRPIAVHARPRHFQSKHGMLWYTPHAREAFEAIDYLWPKLSYATGSSGIAGALWARHGMGFDEVILAGIGLSVDDRTYANGYPNNYNQPKAYATDIQVENWAAILKRHKEEGRMEGVYSMSGKTKTILGFPP